MRRVFFAFSAVLWLLASAANAQFTEWSTPVNVGPPVNTEFMDTCAAISKDGLSLIFASNRHTGNAGSADWDLYVTRRATPDGAWETPVALVGLNSSVNDSCPALSLDEHRLFFVSNRPNGCGMNDIYVSTRHDRRDDFGWLAPVNLGCAADGGLNSALGEATPALFEDETGAVMMYFATGRATPGSLDMYSARMKDDGNFEPPVPVSELNTAFAEQGMAVRRDGLEIVFVSNRPGTQGDHDLWRSTRASTAEPWSAPVNLVTLNSTAFDGGRLAMSLDGRALYFRSNRPGGSGSGDLYVATREKVRAAR